jgi:undecaprenyl-diphosphatase
MNLFADITFGALQGLTEFLPISSSGHLVIFHELFGLTGADDLTFDAILQLGTMLALLAAFRQDLLRLTQNGIQWLNGKRTSEIQRDFNLICAIIIGTIPAIGLGLFLQKWMETIFRHSWLVAIILILGSGLMFVAEKTTQPKATPLNLKSGLIIGIFQCLSLIPGMSRSGSTISGGLLLGLSREQATRFSFLLSILSPPRCGIRCRCSVSLPQVHCLPPHSPRKQRTPHQQSAQHPPLTRPRLCKW